MARRCLVVLVLLLGGCRSVVGPFEHRPPQRVDDPLLTIGEQERRGRSDLALPEDSDRVAPRTYTAPTHGVFGNGQ